MPTQDMLHVERCALGAALTDPVAADKVCALLVPQDFQEPMHSLVFSAIASLNLTRAPIDALIVAASLGNAVRISDVLELTQTVTSGAHAQHHAGLVLAASKLRTLRSLGVDLAHSAEHSSATPEAVEHVLEQHRIRLDDVLARTPGRRPIKLSDAEPDLLARILSDSPTPTGLKTGFVDVDRALGGLRDGEMIVLAARPGVGKSLFAANVAENLTFSDSGRAVLFLSLEMSGSQLYRRYLFAASEVPSRVALEGDTNSADKEALEVAHASLRRAPWYVHHEAAMSPQRVQALSRAFKNKHGPCLLVLDYLQLMSAEGYNRQEQVSNISGALKSLAVDLDCPVLVLSQLNRQAADQRDRKDGTTHVVLPSLSDLRDSGAIEQDADVVCFLARDTSQQTAHAATFVLAKNRPGRTGKVQILFDVKGPRFRNLEKEWDGSL